MRLLLTNDDGIAADGLAALERAARQLGEVTVVAPLHVCSGCGHRVTTGVPLRVEEHGPGRFAVDGTPADCVRVALHALGQRFDFVLSGINAGGNLGADIFHSGTVAAVRESALLGLPGVALSHYKRRERDFDWLRASTWVLSVLPDLLARPPEEGAFWNVNLPHPPGDGPDPEVVFCPLDLSPLPVRFRQDGQGFVYDGDYHQRPRRPGGDVEVCFEGRIAVSAVRLG